MLEENYVMDVLSFVAIIVALGLILFTVNIFCFWLFVNLSFLSYFYFFCSITLFFDSFIKILSCYMAHLSPLI